MKIENVKDFIKIIYYAFVLWIKKLLGKEDEVEIIKEATKLFDVHGNSLFIGQEVLANDTYIFFKGKITISKHGEYFLVNNLGDSVVVTRSTSLFTKEDFVDVKNSAIEKVKVFERKEPISIVERAEKVRRARLNTIVINNLGKADYVIIFENESDLKAQYDKISSFIKKYHNSFWDERNTNSNTFFRGDKSIRFILEGYVTDVKGCVVVPYKELI